MGEGKGERPRLNLYLLCNLEDGLEALSLAVGKFCLVPLRRTCDRADSFHIIFSKAILVRVNSDAISIEFEIQIWLFAECSGFGVRILLRILYELR